MSLNELLATLADNGTLDIEITETVVVSEKTEEVALIEFEAPGWESLSAELLQRTVDKVIIDSSSLYASMKIHLSDN